MLYMVIEQYRDGDPLPVYRRFRECGRMAPEGLGYIGSWVTTDGRRCYQIMECDDPQLLEQWMAHWTDLVDFDVVPVVTSAEAVAAITPRLEPQLADDQAPKRTTRPSNTRASTP